MCVIGDLYSQPVKKSFQCVILPEATLSDGRDVSHDKYSSESRGSELVGENNFQGDTKNFLRVASNAVNLYTSEDKTSNFLRHAMLVAACHMI